MQTTTEHRENYNGMRRLQGFNESSIPTYKYIVRVAQEDLVPLAKRPIYNSSSKNDYSTIGAKNFSHLKITNSSYNINV